jgi:hypothetical protein
MNLADYAASIGYFTEEADDKVRIMVYGETGVGKTRLAGTFPSPFFINANRGLITLRQMGIKPLELKIGRTDHVYKIVKDVLRKLKEKEEPFDKLEVETIVFDDLTDLADFLMADRLLHPSPGGKRRDPSFDKPEWDDYGVLRNQLKEICITARELNYNMVGIAGLKTEMGEVGSSQYGKPLILGSFRDHIGYGFDEYYHMTTEGGGEKLKYVTYTAPHQAVGVHFECKSRTGLPPKIENMDYEKLKSALEKAKGKK